MMVVVFPSMVIPLFVGRDKSVNALERAMSTDKRYSWPRPKPRLTIRRVGHIQGGNGRKHPPDPQAAGRHREGAGGRGCPGPGCSTSSPIRNTLRTGGTARRTPGRARRNGGLASQRSGTAFENYAKHNKKINQEILDAVAAVEQSSRLADTIAPYMPFKVELKQQLLETLPVGQRLESCLVRFVPSWKSSRRKSLIKGRQEADGEDPARVLPH